MRRLINSLGIGPHSDSEPRPLSPPPPLRSGVWVPRGFRNAVILHFVKNFIPILRPPLILAIQGAAGEGKSFQVREVCRELGAEAVSLSGSMLSGSYEGDAVSALKTAYVNASAKCTATDRMTTLLIDDFDLSVASTVEDRRYTVNTQLLTGFLMNLADDPTQCGEVTTKRIPIILTGNDFSRLHGPLRRHGRMNFFNYVPSLEDKVGVIAALLSSHVADVQSRQVEDLVRAFRDEPVSFFAAVIEDVVDNHLLAWVEDSNRINIGALTEVVQDCRRRVDLTAIHSAAERRSQQQARRYT